jgi:acyl carrier protein
MSHRETVLETIRQVCADKGHTPAGLTDDQPLGAGGLGLDSLDMATIVAELDMKLHIDPFANGNPTFQTVGDLVRLFDGGPGD